MIDEYFIFSCPLCFLSHLFGSTTNIYSTDKDTSKAFRYQHSGFIDSTPSPVTRSTHLSFFLVLASRLTRLLLQIHVPMETLALIELSLW